MDGWWMGGWKLTLVWFWDVCVLVDYGEHEQTGFRHAHKIQAIEPCEGGHMYVTCGIGDGCGCKSGILVKNVGGQFRIYEREYFLPSMAPGNCRKLDVGAQVLLMPEEGGLGRIAVINDHQGHCVLPTIITVGDDNQFKKWYAEADRKYHLEERWEQRKRDIASGKISIRVVVEDGADTLGSSDSD